MHLLSTTIIVISLVMSCRGAKNGADQVSTLRKLAREAVGPENTIELNHSETFALCQEKAGASHARKQYRYIVVRLRDMVIVNRGSYTMGYVKWLDDDSIEVFSGSTSMKEADSSKKIIHVNSPLE